jgi:hypothetical protein
MTTVVGILLYILVGLAVFKLTVKWFVGSETDPLDQVVLSGMWLVLSILWPLLVVFIMVVWVVNQIIKWGLK